MNNSKIREDQLSQKGELCLEGRRGGSNGVPRDPRRAQLKQQLGAGSSCDLTCFLLATGQGGNTSREPRF